MDASDIELRQSSSEEMLDFESFHALQLSVPLESTKYSFMSMLLSRALNLKDATLILDPASYKANQHALPVEILPAIAVPSDLWLVSDIGIENSKLKIAFLEDVNSMLARGLQSLNEDTFLELEDNLISAFEGRVAEYKLTEFSMGSSPANSSPLREDEELELENVHEAEATFKDSPMETDASSIFSIPTRLGSVSVPKNKSRMSSFSRDLMSGKRKLSIFSHSSERAEAGPQHEERKSVGSLSAMQISPGASAAEPISPQLVTVNKGSQINGLLSKSRFYNKLVKKRDSQGSTSGSVMSATSSSQRNSANGVDSHDASRLSARYSYHASAVQRVENQKEKYRFYAQAVNLREHIQALVANFGRLGSQTNLITLMEFIKNHVFKFIVVDLCRMIMARAQLGLVRDLSI